ncbi:uncharacterized protein LOC128954563 [Oppia nitens]|uniref:uncharacterized protein LOC128954563 n=1 Tax=Oppia nitens TaxID=1686743 RepID=UPI0023DBFCF9|nr:uncharacterized protein LOC128954563 [Oppia nitens]
MSKQVAKELVRGGGAVGGDNHRQQPLNSRQSRQYLSAKLISMIRQHDTDADGGQHFFSHQELIYFESLLRDEMQTNQWLLNVTKKVTDSGVFVTKQQMDLYNERQSDVIVDQTKVDELNKELAFLNERVQILNYIHKDLTARRSQFVNTTTDPNGNNGHDLTANYTNLRIKLVECLESMKNDLNTDLMVKDPKDIAEQIVNELNSNLKTIEKPDEWLDQWLDELTLSDVDKSQLLDVFNREKCGKLEELCNSLRQLNKECLRIKEFYVINVKEEMSWRTDLNVILNQLQESANDKHCLTVSSMKTVTDGVATKRKLMNEYNKLVKDVESQEMDELSCLIDTLKQRIDVLSKIEF